MGSFGLYGTQKAPSTVAVAGAQPSIFGFSNFTGTNLAAWQAGQAAVAAGTRNAKMLCIGTSITVGTGSEGDPHINVLDNGWPAQLFGLLPRANWSTNMVNNEHGPIDQIAQCDSRLGIDLAAWFINDQCLGGQIFSTNAPGKFSFTPTEQFDTIEIDHPRVPDPSAGVISVAIDGGSVLATGDCHNAGGNVLGQIITTVSLGFHTIEIQLFSGSAGGFTRITAYNSASKRVLIMNAGRVGTRVADWQGTLVPWYTIPRITSHASDLMTLMVNTNDWIPQTDIPTLMSQCQTILNAQFAGGGSAIIMTDTPTNPTVVSDAIQRVYCDAFRALAIANGIPFIDTWALLGGWNLMNSRSQTFDNFHPNGAGYALVAGWVNQALAPGFVSI